MNALDFKFFHSPEGSASADAGEQPPSAASRKHGASSHVRPVGGLLIDDGDRFLRIVERASNVRRHRELYELLQSDDIQRFIPHQILISAWGDFSGLQLQRDVISGLPGLRTGLLHDCTMNGILGILYKRWLAENRQPLLLESANNAQSEYSNCTCKFHIFLQGKWSMLVHGVTNVRDGEVSLYVALRESPIVTGSVEGFRLSVDPLIAQIDVAFRRVAALKSPTIAGHQESRASLPILSRREEEVLAVVAQGKTNFDAARILGVSAFTVKAHMQRIMRKLGAHNRTEAVAKFRDSTVSR